MSEEIETLHVGKLNRREMPTQNAVIPDEWLIPAGSPARCFEPPTPLSWRRFLRLAKPGRSLNRDLQIEAVRGLTVRGMCADIGGGRNAQYWDVIGIDGILQTINIDRKIGPHVVADLNCALPIRDASFDTVLSFNTLEHLAQDQLALSEMMRILRPGGEFHILVPFLIYVHGSPSDHHRHTQSEWSRRLDAFGAQGVSYKIRPLVWDPISSAYAVAEPYFPNVAKVILRLLCMFPAMVRCALSRRPPKWENFALSYYIYGTKA